MQDKKSALLDEARQVMHNLIQSGYEAYVVGGYVRDHLLGRPVHDIDIATSAVPEEVMRLFSRALPTGVEHGTVTVVSGDYSFEVTTFRREGGYQDHRRPDYVVFVDSLTEDLSRRDFTMNAMAIDIEGRVIDPFDGRSDLEAGVLRCVGEAARRFEEDALRMLRCIRFATNYGLRIDDDAWSAIRLMRPSLKHIAMERVRIELEKTIGGSDPERGVELLWRSELLVHTKESLGWKPFVSVDGRTEDIMSQSFFAQKRLHGMSLASRWASLFILGEHHAEEAETIMRKLTFSNEAKHHILRLLSLYEEIRATSTVIEQGEFVRDDRWREKVVASWLKYGRRAAYGCQELLEPSLAGSWATGLREAIGAWLDHIHIWTPAELAVDGHDMMRLRRSLRKGPWIGQILQQLTVDVALGQLTNTKERLLAQAEHYIEEWDIR